MKKQFGFVHPALLLIAVFLFLILYLGLTGKRPDFISLRKQLQNIFAEEQVISSTSIVDQSFVRAITTSKKAGNPAISDNSVVYHDARNGNTDIYLYDLESKTERQITSNSSDQTDSDIWGNKIVWVDWRSDNNSRNIYLYDLQTNQERAITTGGSNPKFKLYPRIYGNKIVWQDNREGFSVSNSQWDIYFYDLETGIEKRVTSDPADQIRPAIFENKIVWMDYRHGGVDLYLYDLTTESERRITSSPIYIEDPAISGSKIVWNNRGTPDSNVYLYDLETNQTQKISDSSFTKNNADLSGNKVVWAGHESFYDAANIYLFDLGKKQQFKVTNDSTIEHLYPKIDGDRVVWQDHRDCGTAFSAFCNIYIFDPPKDIDSDSDGFSDSLEDYLGTNKNNSCADTTRPNDEDVDAFPPDFNDDKKVNIQEDGLMTAAIKQYLARGILEKRFDLDGNGKNDEADQTVLGAWIDTTQGEACTS